MARSVTCPRCGIRTKSKFMTDPNKRPRHVGELRKRDERMAEQ